jgi:hypothetical protein
VPSDPALIPGRGTTLVLIVACLFVALIVARRR